MATFTNRNGRITAQIRKPGPAGRKSSYSATFDSMEAAQTWAREAEATIERNIEAHGADFPHEVALLPRYNADSCAIGVYFLFNRHECVYVGQSLNVHVRVREHRASRNGAKQFDSYSFLPVPRDRLSEVEAQYIAAIRPKLNGLLNPIAKLQKRLEKTRRPAAKEALAADLAREKSYASATSKMRPLGIS